MGSVFTKTWLKSVSVLAIAFILVVWIADKAVLRESYADFRFDAKTESELLLLRLADVPLSDFQEQIIDYEPIFDLQIKGIVSQYPSVWVAAEDDPNAYFNSLDEDPWQAAIRVADSGKYLLIVESSGAPDFLSLMQFFAPLAVVFLVLGACLYYLSRQIELPIKQLSFATRALAAGDYSSRVGSEFDQPFASLGRSFDDMAAQIQQLMGDQQVLIGAVPHELRTPVSRLRFALDMTRAADSLPKIRDRIASIDQYLGDLENVMERTLLLSKLQQPGAVEADQFDLELLMESVCSRQVENSTVTVSCTFASPVERARGERGLLEMALCNLLDNAIRHAHAQVRVVVEVRDRHDVRISIEDDGDGIPHASQSQLFVPFARLDDSRSRDSGGLGLGLSIVDLIMRQHDGTVFYRQSSLGGAMFVLEWQAF